jgi:hypothetical protein
MKIKSCNHIATQSNRLTEARYGLTVGEQKVISLLTLWSFINKGLAVSENKIKQGKTR